MNNNDSYILFYIYSFLHSELQDLQELGENFESFMTNEYIRKISYDLIVRFQSLYRETQRMTILVDALQKDIEQCLDSGRVDISKQSIYKIPATKKPNIFARIMNLFKKKKNS